MGFCGGFYLTTGKRFGIICLWQWVFSRRKDDGLERRSNRRDCGGAVNVPAGLEADEHCKLCNLSWRFVKWQE